MILLAVGVVGVCASIMLAAVAVAMPPPRWEQLLKSLALYTNRANGGADIAVITTTPETTAAGTLDRIGELITLPGDRERLSHGLDIAGNPADWPIARVIRTRPLTVLGLGIFGPLLGNNLGGGYRVVLGLILGIAAGYLLPQILIYNAGAKRQEALLRALPDTMDALVIGVEAGLGLDSAMDQVTRAMKGPMSDELRRVLQEMRLGVSRADALRDLTERTTVRDLKRLVTALVQAGELGISVATILREHANDQRTRRRQRAEETAQKIPVKLLFPVLACMFPAIFVVIIGPAVLQLAKVL
ncbi:type II secretion system F family protein [Actinoplanes rectilineatus]|uniref:type II secretion system F family protein n=1 Tax=Actinoplanes rectilineatus TaxID=113571 RepID=UPI000698D0B4|nr:type II secretion system F family protein [Actinoplanes rectilineatus]